MTLDPKVALEIDQQSVSEERSKASQGDINPNADMELVTAVAQGDMLAFEKLYNKYHKRVYSLCLRMLQNTHQAEDLSQEVFIQLFRKIHTFEGKSAFSTWLHRLTVNQVLMYFRLRAVKLEKLTESGVMPEFVKPVTHVALNSPISDRIAIEDVIGQLPEGYKKVFILHDVYGYEHEEVARILGISTGTSKSQLHKARLKLQKLLKRKANPRLFHIESNEPDVICGVDIQQEILNGEFSLSEAFQMADLAYESEEY